MRTHNIERQIFSRGSTTFFWSSLFFPKKVRRNIFDLYSFVRTADDYVDELPQNPEAFQELRNLWAASTKSTRCDTTKKPADSLNERVVKNMVRLSCEHDFDPKWVDSFLDAMESDLSWEPREARPRASKSRAKSNAAQFYKFQNPEILMFYIHRSGGVVGLMLARIMDLPKQADTYAEMLGRSLQTVNFIRDIQEDTRLGRCYYVNSDFEQFGLHDLSEEAAQSNPDAFRAFIHDQLVRYRQQQDLAIEGFEYIPWRCRIPIKTAVDMYGWTAQQIAKDPLIVFQKKVKPSRLRILKTALSNIFTIYFRN